MVEGVALDSYLWYNALVINRGRGHLKYFFGFLAFLAATLVVVLVILNLIRNFNTGDKIITTSLSYSVSDPSAIDSVVRYTVAGPVVANEDYRQIVATVSKNTRTVEVLKGYTKTVEKSSVLPNTPEAYKAFLGALEAAKFAAKRNNAAGDPRTICVSGNKYYYELALNGEKKIDTWTTSCSFGLGSFAGNAEGTASLFRVQFPNYNDITNGVNLSTL